MTVAHGSRLVGRSAGVSRLLVRAWCPDLGGVSLLGGWLVPGTPQGESRPYLGVFLTPLTKPLLGVTDVGSDPDTDERARVHAVRFMIVHERRSVHEHVPGGGQRA